MANSMLAAVRNAVADVALMSSAEDQPSGPAGHAPSSQGDKSMSEKTGTPAAESAGISQADHDAAVAAARSEGHAAGAAEANTRLGATLGAEGIKGDGGRMSAALDLAMKSPGMSAEDVAGYVTENVAASAGPDSAASDYEAARHSAAGLTQPTSKAKRSGLSAEVDKVVGKN